MIKQSLCTFDLGGVRQKGIIQWDYVNGEDTYVLSHAEPVAGLNCVSGRTDLIVLLESWSVELKEGEIIYYDNHKSS